jgi:hypothetical protein
VPDTYDSAAEAEADRVRQRTPYRDRRHRLMHAGEVLLKGCRCPIFEACRALLARGITGRLEVWRPDRPLADVRLNIEKGAGFTVMATEQPTEQRPRPGAFGSAPTNHVSKR